MSCRVFGCLQVGDFDVDGSGAKEPLDALNGLFGIDDIRERLEGYGQTANVWQREGRSTAGIVGNMVFTGSVKHLTLCNTPHCTALHCTALHCTTLLYFTLLIGAWRGPGKPGTGKTTVANAIARVLHGFGLLATDHLEITSGLDLTGIVI
jgi:hypothetical protein